MELDEELRGRLRRLAEHTGGLDDAARRRVRSAIHERALKKRARFVWLLAPAMLVSSAFAWWVAAPSQPLQPEPPVQVGAQKQAVPAVHESPAEAPGAPLERQLESAPAKAKVTRERVLPRDERADVIGDAAIGTSVPEASYELWRQGDLPAFQPEPPEIPTSVQPDGRPMKKPHVVP